MIRRFAAAMGSMVTLIGAFVIGAVLHQTLVQNNFPITRPIAVAGLVVGLVVIWVGLYLEGQFEPSDYVPSAEEDDDGDEDDESDAEFDDRLSPVSEDMLEDREADESYDG